MKNSFYNVYRERHNIPTMDEKLVAAGVVVTAAKGELALERELVEAIGEDEAITKIRDIYRESGCKMEVIRKLQRAVDIATNPGSDAAILSDFASEPGDGDEIDPRQNLLPY